MKSLFKKMDKVLLFLVIAFTILGLVMVFSASSMTAVLYYEAAEYYYFKKQLFIIIGAWTLGIIVLFFPTYKYKFWGPVGMMAILGLLLALIPYGTITNSAKRWFDLGFFSLHPSEFAKTIIIVYLAVYFDKIVRKKEITLNKVIMPFIFVFAVFALTALQPDLGTAVIIGGIAFLIFMSLPIKNKEVKLMKRVGIVTVVVVACLVFVGGNFLNAEQTSRLTYQAPCTRYTEKTGYQVCNGFIAIANGGLFGAGLGNSTQKYLYLPEAYTDFIFPVTVEELGAIAGIIIIIFYIIILYRILMIARNAVNLRGSIMAYGTFAVLLLHLFVNLMGILALIPLTGVPLPFLSYGGSFYINVIFLLCLTQRVKIETEDAKKDRVLK